MYDEDIRRKADHPNRREILVLVIAGIGIHRWRDRHRRRVTQQDRVPVGCGLRDETGSDRATGTAFVLHHDLLAECRRKLVADNACHDRSAATRRKWHDQGDRSARIILGIGNTGDAHETDRNQRVECIVTRPSAPAFSRARPTSFLPCRYRLHIPPVSTSKDRRLPYESALAPRGYRRSCAILR